MSPRVVRGRTLRYPETMVGGEARVIVLRNGELRQHGVTSPLRSCAAGWDGNGSQRVVTEGLLVADIELDTATGFLAKRYKS